MKKWSDFIELVDFSEDHKALYPCYFYRGQSDLKWDLKTSLTRLIEQSDISIKKVDFYERQALGDFSSKYHLYKPLNHREPENKISWYILMQHYFCPTRLLDWSNSPFVALYFAVNENHDKDGAFFMINNTELDKIQEEQYDELKRIKVEEVLEFKKSDIILGVRNPFENERTLMQQGVFTFSNNPTKTHSEIIDNIYKNSNKTSPILKIIISKEMKIEILARLKKMNISGLTLFPGLDGIGKSISELLSIRRWAKE